jgi:dynamin 1-like protein
MVKHMYKEDLLPDLLRETDDVAQRRQNCNDMRDLLNRAMAIVNETTQLKIG